MRPVLVCDLTSAARALLLVKPDKWIELAELLIKNADFGDRYTRRFGHVHADFGDGTLSAAARKRPLAKEPTLDDFIYCECLSVVVRQLMKRRTKADDNVKT